MNDRVTNIFQQLHIDVARNATDDFNLFHDSKKWQRIANNPFNGPILLGFQLESLVEDKIETYRLGHCEDLLIQNHQLNYSNYQFSFVGTVKPGQAVSIEIKESIFKSVPHATLSNRVLVKSDEGLVLVGHKKETATPLFCPDIDFSMLGQLDNQPDRSFLSNHSFFLKRKFMTTSNAKNFLCASLRDQTKYFDELENKVSFPEMFPCALLSSALLEKAMKLNHDFERNPMVYTSHKISIDRRLLGQLKSTDALHILIRPHQNSTQHDFGNTSNTALNYECYGLVNNNGILYRAIISLASLALVCKAAD